MKNLTTVHKHGPDPKYKRTAIPQDISNALDMKLGDVVKWEVIDRNSVTITIIDR